MMDVEDASAQAVQRCVRSLAVSSAKDGVVGAFLGLQRFQDGPGWSRCGFNWDGTLVAQVW